MEDNNKNHHLEESTARSCDVVSWSKETDAVIIEEYLEMRNRSIQQGVKKLKIV